jgi:hypothetical protein
MTLTELLTEAQKLSPLDRIRLAIQLLQSVTSKWSMPSSPQIASSQPSSLLDYLATLSPLDEDWPDVDEGLLPLEDDIDL